MVSLPPSELVLGVGDVSDQRFLPGDGRGLNDQLLSCLSGEPVIMAKETVWRESTWTWERDIHNLDASPRHGEPTNHNAAAITKCQ